MHQPAKHINVPRPFESGNVIEWLNRFDICAKANGWDAAVKAVKLLTLLEDEVLAVWLDLTEEQQSDYLVTVNKLKSKQLASDFHHWKQFTHGSCNLANHYHFFYKI